MIPGRNFSTKIEFIEKKKLCYLINIHTRRCSLINHDSNALNKIDVAIPASNLPTNKT
jgi:hypothetical protein